MLGQNYPNSDWYKDAYACLQRRQEPVENKQSWITKAFARSIRSNPALACGATPL